MDDAEQFIYRHMKIGRRIEGFVGVEYREYPQEAVREVLVNAVVHRDYSRRGQRIRVFMFDDRIEVYSPGTLPPGVSLEKMRRLEPQSVLRNPIVSTSSTQASWGCSETWGAGTLSGWAQASGAWPWRWKGTARECQDLCGVSRATAKRDLRELVDRELLVPMGHGRGLHYMLTRL
ncbi:MAG TPA: hypothetical protein ENL34_12530 [Chloroflexi bacterium]|nr:hypothetical protein [Chloroflexota bacterium]